MSINKVTIPVLLIMVFVVRFIAVVAYSHSAKNPLGADASQYEKMAVDLLAGRGLINHYTGQATSWRMPLYPLFLAGIYYLFGHNIFAVWVIQCILGVLLAAAIYLISKIVFNEKTALLSALTFIFYQPYVFHLFYGGPFFLYSENLFVPLIGLHLFFFIKSLQDKESDVRSSFLAGVFLGLATLTRSIIAVFPFFVFLILYCNGTFRLPAVLRKSLPLLIPFVLIISPWLVRNYLVHHKPFILTTEGGFALLASNNPYAKGDGLTSLDVLFTPEENRLISKMTEVEREKAYQNQAMRYILKNLNLMPKLLLKKMLCFWNVFSTDYFADGSKITRYNIMYSLVLMFSILGFFMPSGQRLNIGRFVLVLLCIYFSGVSLIFMGEPRMRYPLEPFLIIFANHGVASVYNDSRSKVLFCALIIAIIGVNLLLYINSNLIFYRFGVLVKNLTL